MARDKRNKLSRAAGILAALLLLALMPLGFFETASASGRVLKVGCSDSVGAVLEEDGGVSGYPVDYLEELGKYTGWRYEFVYDTWTNCLNALESGDIDLLVMVHYSEERAEKFLFSDLSMAHDYTSLYAAAGSDIYYKDYDAFDGCRVGVVENTLFQEFFVIYAGEMGFDYELVLFDTETEAKAAMLGGEIDMIATSGFSDHPEVKLVDRFQMERVYLAANASDQALMDEVNEAIQKARIQNRNLENDLLETYYDTSATGLYLTREEQEYIDTVGTITIKGFDGRRPLGYTTENGKFVGVLVDYLNMLGSVSGLTFAHETTDASSLADAAPMMEKEDCAIVFIDQPLRELGLENSLYKTNSLFETGLVYVRRQGEVVTKTDPHTFALIPEMSYLEEMLLDTYEGYSVVYYDTSTECMEAVADGDADMTILDEHIAVYLLQKPKFADKLVHISGSTYYVDNMCLYAPESHRLLVSILNKTLDVVSEQYRLNAISNAMITHSYEYKLEDILYEYGNFIFISAVLFIVAIALGTLLVIRIIKFRTQKKENEALQERIQLDELTGVYNRKYFFEKAGEMIDRSGEDICVIRLNVCNFKLVNDLYGVTKGDRLLREMGRDLRELSRQKDFIVGRFTADHFYLCIHMSDFESINFARRAPAPWLGMDITLTYGVYPVKIQKDIPVSAMCDRADMAITAGQSPSEYIFYYSDDARQQMLREQEIENEMEQAVAERQFCIYIQPKYDVETDSIVGGEALVRWTHPQKGMIPPGEFIGLFEKNGFILKLDYYVWEESCRFLSEAKRKGLPSYPVSVNVSRIHFYGTELQTKLLELIGKYDLEPGQLELEITESMCAEKPEVIFSRCEELRKAGFKISMDDFGSGYSSLNMLKEMPLDIIKMDLKFLSGETDADQNKKGRNILRTQIELAKTLGIKVVVEGLETESQRDFIRSIGNCVAQGYYYSKPVDCQSYEKMITA